MTYANFYVSWPERKRLKRGRLLPLACVSLLKKSCASGRKILSEKGKYMRDCNFLALTYKNDIANKIVRSLLSHTAALATSLSPTTVLCGMNSEEIKK
jgi:Zn-finger protein